MDLERDLFVPVAQRVRERADSLQAMRRFPRSGIEGWLKVEVVAALGDKVAKVQNRGADLYIEEAVQIELKAATNLEPNYLRGGATKYNMPCIFLCDGRDTGRLAQIVGGGIKWVAYEVFSDGVNDWVVGMIVPEKWPGAYLGVE